MTTHDERLPDEVVEALASGRDDLVDDAIRQQLSVREDWRLQVAEAKALSIDIGLLLRDAVPPAVDLELLVAGAMRAQPLAPTRRSLWVAALLGAVTTVSLAILSIDRFPTVRQALGLLGLVATLVRALDQLVSQLPGQWGTVSLGLTLGLFAILSPARLLARQRAAALALLVLCSAPLGAGAQRLTGDWPESETTVEVSASHLKTSEVLGAAAASAGLGFFCVPLEPDATVSLQLRSGSLRDVVETVLAGRDDLEVRRTATMLSVRPLSVSLSAQPASTPPSVQPASAPPSPAVTGVAVSSAPTPAALPPMPSMPPMVPPPPVVVHDDDLPERVTFGGDVVVRAGERVRSVVTMGGDAIIEGEVVGDVVTMGGDVIVREGGVIRGEMVTMGGEVTVDDGAMVHHSAIHLPRLVHHGHGEHDESRMWSSVLGSAAKHGLLFLLGLVLLGAARERHAVTMQAIARTPVRAGLIGALGLVSAFVLSVVLAITLIGIPGALVLSMGTFIGVCVGWTIAASLIGRVLPLGFLERRPVAQLGAGIVVLFLLAQVPVLGALLYVVLACVGFGALLMTRLGRQEP